MRDNFTFFHPLRVRWAECDAQNIVFFGNYFTYFDVGMTEYFRALGFKFDGDDALEFYTVHAEADYRDSAVFDDEIDVGVRCLRLGQTSLQMGFAIFRGDELLVEGRTAYVHALRKTKTKELLPQDFVERVLAFEKTPPERG